MMILFPGAAHGFPTKYLNSLGIGNAHYYYTLVYSLLCDDVVCVTVVEEQFSLKF